MPHTPAAASSHDVLGAARAGMNDDDELLFDDDLLVEGDDVEGEELALSDTFDEGAGEILELDEVLDDPAVVVEGTAGFDRNALTRRDVWHGLVHCIVSNAKLWSTVDIAEVKEVMEGPVAVLPHGPLLLEPLWRYMIAKGTSKRAAAETLLFFHSRASRWGVQIELPASMNELQEETRVAVAEKMKARGVTTGTFVGRAPTGAERVVERGSQRKKLVAKTKSKSVEGEPGALRALAAKIALVVSLAVVGGLVVLREGPPDDVSARASAALGPVCDRASQVGRAVLCTTDSVTLATSHGLREKRAVTEVALDVAIVFVDKAGAPLPMPPAR